MTPAARASARSRWRGAAIVCAALAMLGAPAHVMAKNERAGALVTAPATWRSDPEQATALAQRFAAADRGSSGLSVTATEAYVAERPGIALFATRATATVADTAQAARLARATLDDLRASTRRASLAGGAAQEQSWHERVEADSKQIVASLMWADPTSRTLETARIVIASDGARIAAVTGECLASDEADAALVTACRNALATLDPGIPPAGRVDIALAAAEGPGSAPSQPAREASRREPSRLDPGPRDRVVYPPTPISQAPRAPDRRPIYAGAGLIALAFVFWWNRRRRDRFEREDRRTRPAPAPRDDGDDLRAAASSPRDVDEDADDLHAAARGERPETDERTEPDEHRRVDPVDPPSHRQDP